MQKSLLEFWIWKFEKNNKVILITIYTVSPINMYTNIFWDKKLTLINSV